MFHVTLKELEAKAGYRQYRLTQMFSATMPPPVEQLARKYLRLPAYISIGDPGAGKRAIEQRLEFINEGKKRQVVKKKRQILFFCQMVCVMFLVSCSSDYKKF
jgi:ATP-dependent RNA helicase DDX23/PRP28